MIARRSPSLRRRGGRNRLRRLSGVDDARSMSRQRFRERIALLDHHPKSGGLILAALGAGGAGIWSGPVAAAIAATYASIAVGIVVGRHRDAAERAAAGRATDGLVALTAELRAGAEPSSATAAVLPTIRSSGATGVHTAERIAAACRVAEITGARLADLLDRLEEDVRATARVRELAFAQAAGAQATTWLLAALPVAGIGLGYGIGADPLHELLHTRIGAMCAGIALTFQVAGLAWASRLARATRNAT
jgi:tight adherence protein B